MGPGNEANLPELLRKHGNDRHILEVEISASFSCQAFLRDILSYFNCKSTLETFSMISTLFSISVHDLPSFYMNVVERPDSLYGLKYQQPSNECVSITFQFHSRILSSLPFEQAGF